MLTELAILSSLLLCVANGTLDNDLGTRSKQAGAASFESMLSSLSHLMLFEGNVTVGWPSKVAAPGILSGMKGRKDGRMKRS